MVYVFLLVDLGEPQGLLLDNDNRHDQCRY